MRILHLSADYPDPLAPAKTKAIANLLALAEGPEHRVISLNRVGWRARTAALGFADAAGPAHRAVAYGAPPKGLFHERFLLRLADWIEADCAAAAFRPDLVHAHKLSVEGIAGAALARRFGVPLLVTLQGDSDLRIVGAKRDLRAAYARIWREAAVVFAFAPWTAERMAALLGPRGGPVPLLPCPVLADERRAPQVGPATVVSAFHFASAGRKNAAALIRAAGRAGREAPDLRLDLIGGGDPAAFAALSRLAEAEAPGRVRFLGALPNAEVARRLGEAAAFALVSKRESFGMVFSEALLAGAPCLVPQGWGIDGWFEEGAVTVAADPADEAAIAAGLLRLVREQAAFKARLAALGAAGGLEPLRRPAIRAAYLAALETAAAG